jgi:FkbM family methyltransferase
MGDAYENLGHFKFAGFDKSTESTVNFPQQTLSKTKPVFLFGSGEFGKDVAKVLKAHGYAIQGFINTSPKENVVNEIPVFSLEDIRQQDLSAPVLVCIFNRDTPLDSLENNIRNKGFKEVFMPWDIYQEFGKELGWKYWLSGRDLLLKHEKHIESTVELLSDEMSKQTLIDICNFRLGINTEYASFKHKDRQYFNDLTLEQFASGRSCNYIDCGAYNGDTLIEAHQFLKIENAYLFEPDAENYAQLIANVRKSLLNPICFPLAVSDSYQILSFNSNGEGGTITEKGSVHIAAAALDDVYANTKIDFIKYDVEGAEIQALQGSKKIIAHSRPVLVISIYHRPQDLWEIPALLSQLCPHYKFYLRQHFYNSFDSVLYAIPH